MAQTAPHRFLQRGQTGTRDVALVSRYQLFGKPRTRYVPHQQVDQHVRGGLGAASPSRQRGDPRAELSDLDHPDVLDRPRDQIVER